MKIPNLSKDIGIFGKVSLVDSLAFTKHIGLMLKSGIALPESILILEKQTSHPAFKKLLVNFTRRSPMGNLFTKLSRYSPCFDPFYVSLIKVAEESGSLEKNLDYLAVHLKKQHEFSGKVKGALLYPSIILGVALVSGIGLSIFVLPQLIDLFESLEIELPLSTKILLFFAQIMRDFRVVLLGALIAYIAFFRWAISTRIIKPHWHAFLLSLPVLGVFFQNVELASMFRNIGTMLGVGVHISTALNAQYETSTNLVYKNISKPSKTALRKESLSKKFSLKLTKAHASYRSPDDRCRRKNRKT